MKGIITTYSIDRDYFKVGEAYSLHIKENKFVIAILVKVTDNDVTFKYFENEECIELTVTVSHLMFHNSYDITRMKPDYETRITTD